MRLTRPWRVILAVSIGMFAIAGCAPPKPPASKPAPNLQPRLDDANALVRVGCFDCLTAALTEYDALRTFTGASPAIVDSATTGAIRAALLLELRERELGTTNDQYLAKARRYMTGRDDLSPAFASAFEVLGRHREARQHERHRGPALMPAKRAAQQRIRLFELSQQHLVDRDVIVNLGESRLELLELGELLDIDRGPAVRYAARSRACRRLVHRERRIAIGRER